MSSRGPRGQVGRLGWLALATGIVLLCFVLATPRSGGPDEPSHMVASAALVRGEMDGAVVPGAPELRTFDVPAMVGEPNPACWAQQPAVPAGCASLVTDDTSDFPAVTTSYNYPPWAYVLPGLASYLPSAGAYQYAARALMALIPAVLVVASLARIRRVGVGPAIATLLGITPIAWFSMSIVNPSAVAIAGGLALWTSLLLIGSPTAGSGRRGRDDLLLLAGWAATLLPRRDGPIWATLIVIAACAFLSMRPRDLLGSLRPGVRWAMIAILPLPPATALLNEQRGLNLLIAVLPLGLVAVDLVMTMWRTAVGVGRRAAIVAASTVVVIVVAFVAVSARPGGLDAVTTRLVISNTGRHVTQLVGVLGWLDAPTPSIVVALFWVAVGVLLAGALQHRPRIAAIALGSIAATIVTAWLLELGQGSPGGTYWQGRYSMPFVIGVPMMLALRTTRSHSTGGEGAEGVSSAGVSCGGEGGEAGAGVVGALDSLAVIAALAAVTWVVWNAAFVAALHRWGAGVNGPLSPSSWTSYGAPVDPLILIIVHAVASCGLIGILWTPDRSADVDPTDLDATDDVGLTTVSAT